MNARTMPTRVAVLIAAGLTGGLLAQGAPSAGRQGGRAAAPSPYPVTPGKASRFEQIADGVYYGTGSSGGNSPVVVGDRS